MSSWRAGCGGTRTSGSGVRAGETGHPKGGTALRSDTHYWAADVLEECGATVHLAHPLGNNWGHRRLKNDERDATDLIDLLRMGRLAEAWIAPPQLREMRELIRSRAKLVNLRSGLKAQVHAVLAKEGISVPMSDLFGLAGQHLLDTVPLAPAYRFRVESLRELIELINPQVAACEEQAAPWLAGDLGYHAVQAIPGVGPVLAAIFVAEIGDVSRFASARHLCSWAGLTPRPPRVRPKGPPRSHHQTGITTRALGGGRRRRSPARGHGHRRAPPPRRRTPRHERRACGGRPQASHPRLLRPARRGDPLPGKGGVRPGTDATWCELVVCHGPRLLAARPRA